MLLLRLLLRLQQLGRGWRMQRRRRTTGAQSWATEYRCALRRASVFYDASTQRFSLPSHVPSPRQVRHRGPPLDLRGEAAGGVALAAARWEDAVLPAALAAASTATASPPPLARAAAAGLSSRDGGAYAFVALHQPSAAAVAALQALLEPPPPPQEPQAEAAATATPLPVEALSATSEAAPDIASTAAAAAAAAAATAGVDLILPADGHWHAGAIVSEDASTGLTTALLGGLGVEVCVPMWATRQRLAPGTAVAVSAAGPAFLPADLEAAIDAEMAAALEKGGGEAAPVPPALGRELAPGQALRRGVVKAVTASGYTVALSGRAEEEDEDAEGTLSSYAGWTRSRPAAAAAAAVAAARSGDGKPPLAPLPAAPHNPAPTSSPFIVEVLPCQCVPLDWLAAAHPLRIADASTLALVAALSPSRPAPPLRGAGSAPFVGSPLPGAWTPRTFDDAPQSPPLEPWLAALHDGAWRTLTAPGGGLIGAATSPGFSAPGAVSPLQQQQQQQQQQQPALLGALQQPSGDPHAALLPPWAPCLRLPAVLLPGHAYEVRVAAVNACGPAAWGAAISVTAPAGPPPVAPLLTALAAAGASSSSFSADGGASDAPATAAAAAASAAAVGETWADVALHFDSLEPPRGGPAAVAAPVAEAGSAARWAIDGADWGLPTSSSGSGSGSGGPQGGWIVQVAEVAHPSSAAAAAAATLGPFRTVHAGSLPSIFVRPSAPPHISKITSAESSAAAATATTPLAEVVPPLRARGGGGGGVSESKGGGCDDDSRLPASSVLAYRCRIAGLEPGTTYVVRGRYATLSPSPTPQRLWSPWSVSATVVRTLAAPPAPPVGLSAALLPADEAVWKAFGVEREPAPAAAAASVLAAASSFRRLDASARPRGSSGALASLACAALLSWRPPPTARQAAPVQSYDVEVALSSASPSAMLMCTALKVASSAAAAGAGSRRSVAHLEAVSVSVTSPPAAAAGSTSAVALLSVAAPSTAAACQLVLGALCPGATYAVRVRASTAAAPPTAGGSGGAGAWSPLVAFRAPPDVPAEPPAPVLLVPGQTAVRVGIGRPTAHTTGSGTLPVAGHAAVQVADHASGASVAAAAAASASDVLGFEIQRVHLTPPAAAPGGSGAATAAAGDHTGDTDTQVWAATLRLSQPALAAAAAAALSNGGPHAVHQHAVAADAALSGTAYASAARACAAAPLNGSGLVPPPSGGVGVRLGKLLPGEVYAVRVAAVGEAGQGAWGPWAAFATLPASAAVAAQAADASSSSNNSGAGSSTPTAAAHSMSSAAAAADTGPGRTAVSSGKPRSTSVTAATAAAAASISADAGAARRKAAKPPTATAAAAAESDSILDGSSSGRAGGGRPPFVSPPQRRGSGAVPAPLAVRWPLLVQAAVALGCGRPDGRVLWAAVLVLLLFVVLAREALRP